MVAPHPLPRAIGYQSSMNRLPTDLVTFRQTIVNTEGRAYIVSPSPSGWCLTLLTLHECP